MRQPTHSLYNHTPKQHRSQLPNLNEKDEKGLIKIDRREADAIREKLPEAHIVTVNKQKKYKKYWAEESRSVMRLLGQMRGTAPTYSERKSRNSSGNSRSNNHRYGGKRPSR